MLKFGFLDKVTQQAKEIFPTELATDVICGIIAKMNLVSREEFDVQTKVLARTRAKVEALEAQLDELLAAQVTEQQHRKD
jgi:BMFP domain-containing protein YqiC